MLGCLLRKRVYAVIIIVLSIGMLTGCSGAGVSKESFGLEYNGKKYIAGNMIPEGDELYDVTGRTVIDGLMFDIDNSHSIRLIEVSPDASENVKTLCGVRMGDSIERVINIFGPNLMYDEFKNQPSLDIETAKLTIQYCYYTENGKLVGIADKVNMQHVMKMRMDEKEQEYFESISDKVLQESYYVTFEFRKGKVTDIRFNYTKINI